jgi:hypothetical protein
MAQSTNVHKIKSWRAYNSRVEYTSDKRAVGSSSLPRLRIFENLQKKGTSSI